MEQVDNQITTITFLHFDEGNKWWMFRQMGLSAPTLKQTEGLSFFKLMGSGANGFSIRPDFTTYILLCVWKAPDYAHSFFKDSDLFKSLLDRSGRYWTVFLYNVKSHGRWDGIQPFQSAPAEETSLYVVLTRATIKPHRVFQFWRHVPAVSDDLQGQEGLIYSKGIGEFPILMQATVSFWQSREDMVKYAYRSKLHAGVIAKTRRLGWYREELFANFRPYHAEGNFEHPLSAYFAEIELKK